VRLPFSDSVGFEILPTKDKAGAEAQAEDTEQDICHLCKHRKKIGILSTTGGQTMSLKHKGVQGWAKDGERSAGFRVGMYGVTVF